MSGQDFYPLNSETRLGYSSFVYVNTDKLFFSSYLMTKSGQPSEKS